MIAEHTLTDFVNLSSILRQSWRRRSGVLMMAGVTPPAWFKPEVTVGTLISGLLLLGAVFGLYWNVAVGVTAGNTEAAQMRRDVVKLEGAVMKGFSDVAAQIANLPDQKARLEQVEKRLAEQQAALEETRRIAIQTQAEVQAYLRGTAPVRR